MIASHCPSRVSLTLLPGCIRHRQRGISTTGIGQNIFDLESTNNVRHSWRFSVQVTVRYSSTRAAGFCPGGAWLSVLLLYQEI